MKIKLTLLFCLTIVFTSCYSYKIFPKEYRNYEYKSEQETVFIINPELKKEFAILKQSRVFILTSDSLCLHKIKLLGVKRNMACGQPIIASAITLGQLPIYFPDKYKFSFDFIRNSDTSHKSFELKVATRTWFWDIFKFKKDFNSYAATALLAEYYNATQGYKSVD